MQRRTLACLAAGAALYVLAIASIEPDAVEPTVILVSIDGFRADYLEKFHLPHLQKLAAQGAQADYLIPSFPTKTFPNHYTLVTGLYPAHHGIISNSFYDPLFDDRYSMSDREAVTHGRWYGGKPIWVTLEEAGKATAPFFWPGSEAQIAGYRPTHYRVYDNNVRHEDRVEWIINALEMPEDERPVFLTLYMSVVDEAGHLHGPHSKQVADALQKVDAVIGLLVDRLEAINMLDHVNLLVTGDHGMAATSRERVIFLEDYLDMRTVYVRELDPVAMLEALPNHLDSVETQLRRVPHLRVFRRDSVPPELHFRGHIRIPSLIGIAAEGWRIGKRSTMQRNPRLYDGGTHGHDPALPSMRTIFIARGPDIARGNRVQPHSNVHVYTLMAHILGIDPVPNDGSIDSVRAFLRD